MALFACPLSGRECLSAGGAGEQGVPGQTPPDALLAPLDDQGASLRVGGAVGVVVGRNVLGRVDVREVGDAALGVAGASLTMLRELPVQAGLPQRPEGCEVTARLGEVVAAIAELVSPPAQPSVFVAPVRLRAGL